MSHPFVRSLVCSLIGLASCADSTEPLPDAGLSIPDAAPPLDAGWMAAPGPACDDGVLEPGEACLGRTVYQALDQFWVPYSTADRNGDGLDDVVAVGAPSAGASLSVGVFISERGAYERAWTLTPISAMDVEDIDGDEREDLVVSFTSSASWWKGAADGTFVEPTWFSLPRPLHPEGRDIGIVDLESDGVVEVVVIGAPAEEPTNPRIFVGSFDGETFAMHTEHPLPRFDWTLLPLDWDGDGALELLLAGRVYAYAEPTNYLLSDDGTRLEAVDLPFADLDNPFGSLRLLELDGAPPIDFANSDRERVRLFWNRAGVIEELPALPRALDAAFAFFGPVDGDPLDELVEVGFVSGTIVIRDLPSGMVMEERTSPFVHFAGNSRWDANGDGIPDLAITGEVDQIYLRSADGILDPPIEWRTEDLFHFDDVQLEADGDAAMDLIRHPFAVSLGRHQNAVVVMPEREADSTLDRWEQIASVDLAGDDLPDMVLRSRAGVLATLRGDGVGLGQPQSQLGVVDALAVADFDSDLLPDFAVAIDDAIGIARSDESGAILAPVAVVLAGALVLEMCAADVTGDGMIDVVHRTAGVVGVMAGDGAGGLETTATSSTPSALLVCADLDRDGASEIVLRSSDDLLVLDGDLNVKSVRPALGVRHVTGGDFDADGDLDLAGTSDESVLLFAGDLTGELLAGIELLPHCCRGQVLTADIDGDGRDDLLFSETFQGLYDQESISVLLGGPSGLELSRTFAVTSPPPDDRVTDVLPHLAVADVNRDGAPDVVMTRRAQILVFYAYP